MKSWLIGIAVIAVFSIIGTGGVVWYGARQYDAGYDKAIQDVATARAKANIELNKRKRKESHASKNLDSDATNRELCKFGWLRDIENCPK